MTSASRTIAVVGASGSVGRRLYPFLERAFSGARRVIGTHFSHEVPGGVSLDITSDDAVQYFVGDARPEVIVWLSGTKDVAKCEQVPEHALRLNSRPIETLVRCIETSSPATRVIYLSSDYVFDGNRGLYHDDDACAPRTSYGRSKLLAEEALRASNVDHLILRTSAVMIRENGFLGWLLKELKGSRDVSLFRNTYFSPTPIDVLNQAIAVLIDQRSWTNRVVHVSGPRMSRSEFGVELAKALGVAPSLVAAADADLSGSTFQRDLSLVTSNELRHLTAQIWADLVQEARG